MQDIFGFSGKSVLVIGASDGIGLEIVRQLTAHNTHLALVARNKERLERVAKGLGSHSSLGGLDIVVLSAGNAGPENLAAPVDKIESFEYLHKVHVHSTLTIMQACDDALKQSKGCVVVVSSLASEVPWPRTAPYNTAKASQHALLKNYALDLAPWGVRVNAVLPACIHTEGMDRMAMKIGANIEEFAERRGNAHPMQRCGTPQEVASAVLFLASSKLSGFTTGQMLNVDGGLMLTNWFNTPAMQQIGR